MINRLAFILLKNISYFLRPFRHGYYIRILQRAYEIQGVIFKGDVKYIHHDVYIDNIGEVIIGENVVISTRCILLAHDYSSLVYKKNPRCISKLTIGNNCFIGAGAILLPGTIIGNNCIIGAGSVVKGTIPNNSVVIGNPCKILKTISKDE